MMIKMLGIIIIDILIIILVKYNDLYLVIGIHDDCYNLENYLKIYENLIEYFKKRDVNLLDIVKLKNICLYV